MHDTIIVAEALSVLYLLIILFSMLCGENKHRTSASFIRCLCVAVVGLGMDWLSYVLDGTSVSSFWLTIVNMLSFLGYDFELMTFAIYVWTIVSEKEKVSRGFVRFINVACLADILFVIVGTATEKLFRIEDGDYVSGPWYNLGGVIGFIILVSLLVFALKKRKAVGNKPAVFIVIFFVITYSSMFITLFTGLDSFLYVCMALVMMLVYIILQRGEIESGQIRERIMFELSTRDPLTDLNNRRAYENVLAAFPDASGVGVIFCDVNGLKTANDSLGHAAGDALLRRFSDLLKEYFSPSEIFRISGDEFVVILPDVEENAFLSVVDKLKNAIAWQQDMASVGCALGNGGRVLDLVTMAEKDMYADKDAYYDRHGLNRRNT